MISRPNKNQECVIWYRKSNRAMPYHGKECTIVIPGSGRPLNHLVSFDGILVIVPCGNLITKEKRMELWRKELLKKYDDHKRKSAGGRIKPTPPRYDDVYHDGVAYLDSL